jgi:putative methyltransferase (TIGR04325 family)
MSGIKKLLKNCLPIGVARLIQHYRADDVHFEGDYATWEAAACRCVGYDAALILTKVLDATLRVNRGEAAFERDSVVFDETEYSWPVTAGLMWAAAQSGGRLDVLDFGGALGSSYFQNTAFLSPLHSVRWSVIEQSHYVQAGRDHIQSDSLRFYPSIEECLTENTPSVVLLSSVMQYLPSVDDLIKQIDDTGARIVIIDRTPFTNGVIDRICIQKVPKRIYQASYPMRVFSLIKFLDRFRNWEVVAKTASPEGSLVSGSGFDIQFQGFILRRN